MLPANYHLHSDLSADCDHPLEAMCEAALEAGFTDVCFTEHLDFDRDDPHYGYYDHARAMDAVEAARHRFEGRLTVRSGIEFDFRREYGDEPGEVLAAMPVDFRMGSVHSIHRYRIWKLWDADLEGEDLRAMQAEYFDEVEALVRSGLADGLGHVDYLYKQRPEAFGVLRDDWYWDRVAALLGLCIERGVAIEVNSHHVEDKGMGLAADGAILTRYRGLGGHLLTVGSDAHRPGDVAHGYGPAEAAVREAGFTEITGYAAGEPYPIAS